MHIISQLSIFHMYYIYWKFCHVHIHICIYYQVMASVRCLQWWGDSYVLIGCLDGRVCKWKLGDEETEEVSHLDGSVIIMRWNHERTVSLHMFLYML